MIKISFRKNLIYLLFLIISYFLRRILLIIINKIFRLNNSPIFCILMFIGEISGGLLLFYYQRTFSKKKKNKTNDIISQIIKNKFKLNRADGWPKIYLLIFFATTFDLIESSVLTNFIPKIAVLSPTSTLRLCCIITITSTGLCVFMLGFKIGRHQALSLIIFGICSIIIISLEFHFREQNIPIGNFSISYTLVFCHFIFISFTDITERYLADYDYLNPAQILTTEGIFGFIMTLFFGIYQDPFREIKKIYKEVKAGEFALLIFLLILYSVFSIGINTYKILCNILYSPMTKSLASYFLNFAFIIYYFIAEIDFITDGKSNYLYFFVSLALSLLIEFFGLIYNEFFILSCCNLSKDTHEGISRRAISALIELYTHKNDNDNDIDDHDYIYYDENNNIRGSTSSNGSNL